MYFALTESISVDFLCGLFAGVESDTAFDRTEFELYFEFRTFIPSQIYLWSSKNSLTKHRQLHRMIYSPFFSWGEIKSPFEYIFSPGNKFLTSNSFISGENYWNECASVGEKGAHGNNEKWLANRNNGLNE